MIQKIYYLQDIKTNEYLSNNWRDPRDMNISEAREFSSVVDIEKFLKAEERQCTIEKGSSVYLDVNDHFRIIETIKVDLE